MVVLGADMTCSELQHWSLEPLATCSHTAHAYKAIGLMGKQERMKGE